MDYLQENTFFIPSPAPAPEYFASPDYEQQRKQDMDYLSNYLLSGQYPEHRALAEQAHGHDPYAHAPEEERKCFVGRKACGVLLGNDQVPDMYFHQQNLPIPEGADTREKMYMAVYDHLDGIVKQAKQKQVEEQKALEQYGQQLLGRIDRACKGSGEQWTPKDIDMMSRAGITPDIINRVRTAYAKLPVGSFILDDSDAAKVMTAAGLNKDDLTPDDKKVEDILMSLWGKAVYDNYGANIDRQYENPVAQYAYDSIKPIHNLYYSTLSGAMGVLETLRNADADVPTIMTPGDRMAYDRIPFDNKKTFMSPEEMRQDKGLLRIIDFRAKMKNVRKAAQQAYTEGRQTWGINKFAVTLGDMVGQSVPNAIPYFGVYSLLKGSGTQRYEEGIALGLSREENIKRASLFGVADTLEEKIGMGVLGKVPVLGRLLNAGLNKTGLPYNSFRAKYLASETAQIWGNTAAGVLEEGIAEPIVGGTTRAVMSSFLDDERGKTSLSVIPGDILQNFEGYQGLALAFYSRGFVKLAEPQIRENVKHFTESLAGFTALGGSESGYLRALEIKDTDARNDFITEHLKTEWANNPEQAARRAEQGNAALLGTQEIAQLRELESFRALQERGVIPRFEPAQETGKYRVYLDTETAGTRQKALPSEEGISAENPVAEQTRQGQDYALMTEDQLNTLLSLSIGERERDTILWAQNLLAAEDVIDYLEQQGWKTENIGQTETTATLRTLARQATATVRLLEASGITRQEALASVNPDISEHASLQSIITAYSSSKGRAATARRRREQTSFASNAYVIRQQDPVNGGFQQILRFSRGEVTVENLWEETMEQAAINWCAQENLSLSTFGSQLQDMQRAVNQLYGEKGGIQFIGLDTVPTSGDVVEALSLIGRSRLMHDVVAGTSNLPSWIQKLVRFISSFLEQFRAKAELGHAIAKLESSGQLTPEMQNLINVMTGAVDSIHAQDIRQEADIITAVESSIAEHEAAFTRAGTSQTKTLEDIRAELDDVAAQQEQAEPPTTETPPDPTQPEPDANAFIAPDGTVLAPGQDSRRDADSDSPFIGGNYIQIGEARLGAVRTDSIFHAEDLAQTKRNADASGLTKPLTGKFKRETTPVYLLHRNNGELHIFSGRHKLALARENGIDRIAAYVYEEDTVHTPEWARYEDIRLNILDEQATITEVALYARHLKEANPEADVVADMTHEGLVRIHPQPWRRTPTQIGAFIGANASPDLLDRLKNPDNSLMDEKAAYTICQLTTDATVQQWAGGQIQQGQSIDDIVAGIQQRDAAVSGGQIEYDMFGNAIFNNAEFDHVTRYVNACKAEISRVEALLKSKNRIAKDQPLARQLGLSIDQHTDVASIRKQIASLKIAYNNIGVHPEITAAGRLWKEGEPVHPLKDIPELRLENVEKTDTETIREPRPFDDGEMLFSASLTPIRESAANVQPEGDRAPRINVFWHGVEEKDYRSLPVEEQERLASRGLDELYPMAEAVMQDFDSIVRGIGERLGLRVMMRQTLKGRARALQKTVGDNYGDAGKLLDVFGGTLIMPDSADFSQVISEVRESGMTIARIKNGYKAHDPYGYADIKLNVQMPNGFIGEIILIEEHMMRMKEGPGHKIYEVGRTLQDELERNETNPAYSKPRRRLVTGYVEALQKLSRSYYGNQGQEPIKMAEQEAREAYSKLQGWAFSNASANEESGIVPLAGLGEEMYSDSINLAEPSLATSTWYVFPELSLAQEASPSPLVQNLISSTSDALNNISTGNVASSLNNVKSALEQAGEREDMTLKAAQEQGLFRNGHFEADNAVITEPGVTFSISALHASPYSFRKFSTDFMGKGEGAQAYGWGLYFAESEKVNRRYMDQFGKGSYKFWKVNGKNVPVKELWKVVPGVRERDVPSFYNDLNFLESARKHEKELQELYTYRKNLHADLAERRKTVEQEEFERDIARFTERTRKKKRKERDEELKRIVEGERRELEDIQEDVRNAGLSREWAEAGNTVERAAAMPSNYRVELNVDDSELMGWDYVDETVLALLKDSPVEEVRYALERAERRADDRGENVSGKDVYQELFDAFWDGEDGTRQEAQKAASVSLLSSDIKGIRYADGYTRGKAEEEQTYNYVIFNEKYIKITAFADESTGGAWADYEDPTANFSLAQASVISRLILAPRANEAKAHSLMRGIDEAMNRWNIAASADITHDSAARTFGELNSILAEIQRVLPDNYKINMRPYLNFGAAYARMLETGRIRSYGKLSPEQRNTLAAELQTLMDSPDVLTAIRGEVADQISVRQETTGRGVQEYAQAYRTQQEDIVRSFAEGRLNTLLTSLMTDVRGQLEQYLKDESVAKVLDRIARLMPKKKDNGKYGKGSLPADAYRTLGQYLAMLDADAAAVEAETARLEALIRDASLNQTEAAEGETISIPYEYAGRKENLTLDQLESKLADWQTFGNLAGMNLDETRSAMEAIMTYIQTNRTAWVQKNQQEAWQNEKLAYDISNSIRQHVTVDEQAVRDANENAASSRVEWARAWFSGLQSFSQMLESLSSIDGMKELSQYGISEIAKANISLNTRENNHAAAFAQIIRESAGLRTKRDVEQWILDSKLTRDTGAVTAPVREKTVTLNIQTAREYIDLIEADDREGFEAKRQHIMETARRQRIRPERLGLISEMDIPALMDELAAHPRAGKITLTSRVLDKKGIARPLRLSKAQAMYQILLYEQDRYKLNFERHGYTGQTMQALYRYVGQDGLAVAYGLRDYINQCGIELADVFEKFTGVPFPKEEKYFRAKFNHHEGDAKTAVIGEGNNIMGHKYSMLITRKKHNLGLDLSADVFAVANASLAETDNYICTKHITSKFRGVLSHGYAADALKVNMGAQRYRQLVTWLDLIDGAGTLEAAQLMAHSKFVGRMQGAKANALLAYNLLTCIKQTSAILHPLASGKIGLGELMKEYSLMLSGNSHFTFADMMRTDAFQSRFRKEPVIREILNYGADQHFGYGKRIAMAGMVPLEKMDVWSNAVSHTALANAVFRKLEKENSARIRNGEEPMTTADMEQIALDEVRQSLELAAQPTRTAQKSQLQAMGGTFVRLWTFMGSEAINKFGNLVTFAQKGQWGKLAAAWASLSLWEQTMVTLWMLLMNPPGDKDKDKEKWWKTQAVALPSAMLGSVPVVGATIQTALQTFGLAPYYGNYGSQIIPAGTAVSKIKKATKKKATWQDTFNASLAVLQCLAIGGGVFSDSRSKPVAETASALIGLSAAANLPKVAVKATEEPKKKRR
ncbi:hypothetical protein J5W55_04475 [Akkermansia muciniphila]|uniref:hypothetical protein n=1 Tax=Akkermansia muciniphila TaxID=239935 RepID=UPI001C06428A|nr:hypothetical protein [Akkermansia muciniphila]QWO84512.1 hypothetical protein J5W55_04475 [Akkermansia muciniphila]